MITKGTIQQLRSIWPSIRDEYLDRCWRQAAESLSKANTFEEVKALQVRCAVFKGMMNLPDQIDAWLGDENKG